MRVMQTSVAACPKSFLELFCDEDKHRKCEDEIDKGERNTSCYYRKKKEKESKKESEEECEEDMWVITEKWG